MMTLSPKRILFLAAIVAGGILAAVFHAPAGNAAEEGIAKMNAVISPWKPVGTGKTPPLDAEIPKTLQTATFALG
jgi:hypothetical protein